MNPATLALIITAIQAAIQEAPKVIELVHEVKNFFTALFSKGVITAAQQKQVFDHVDAVCKAALAGQVPPSWTVEADPT